MPQHGPQTMSFTTAPVSDPYLPPSTYSRSPSVDYPGEPSSVNAPSSVQPVKYRSKEHEGRDEARGISDVDFDDNTTYAYASINEFQDKRRQLVNGGVADQMISIQKTVVPKEGVSSKALVSVKRTLCCFILIALLGFFLALAAGGLAAYSFLLSYQNGELINSSPSEMQSTITELMSKIEELKQNLSEVADTHETRYTQLTSQLAQISNDIESIIGDENTTSETPSLNELRSIPVFQNCTTTRYGQCAPASNILTPNSPPTFGVCETASVALDEPGVTNLNLYCAITNVNPNQAEINPSISTLNVSGGQVSCSCNLLVLSNVFPVNGVRCELYITRCPDSLEISTSS